MSLQQAVDDLLTEVQHDGCSNREPAINRVIAQVPDPINDEDDEYQVRRALEGLRDQRCFGALHYCCDALPPRTSREFDARVMRYWAQALIEMDDRRALPVLEDLKARIEDGVGEEESEIIGLLGRYYKGEFVKGGEPSDLIESIGFYQRGFRLDPAWHGSNLVALTARAERDGIALDGTDSAEDWATQLLRKLRKKVEARWEPWDFAAAGEAHLARADDDAVMTAFAQYWRAANSPFALAGTARQLREIWQPQNPENEARIVELATHLDARRLSMAGAATLFSPDELAELSQAVDSATGQAEALYGAGATVPLERLKLLMGKAAAVCRVKQPGVTKRGGTGFLVDGGELAAGLAGQLVLLTNHHVLHGDEASDRVRGHVAYANAVHIDQAVAEFEYWNETSTTKSFKLSTIAAWSHRDELDFTIATFTDAPDPKKGPIKLSGRTDPFPSPNRTAPEQRGKIFIVGHPDGDELSFSLSDNEVVDHELTEKPPTGEFGLRRIHYRAPTTGGSSGSPVMHHEDLEVVGVHRTGNANPLRTPWPGKAQGQDPYEANEAVAIRSIRESLDGRIA